MLQGPAILTRIIVRENVQVFRSVGHLAHLDIKLVFLTPSVVDRLWISLVVSIFKQTQNMVFALHQGKVFSDFILK